MANKLIHAMYDDEQKLLAAAKALVAKGISVKEVFSPFPIHGLDPVIGVKRTRLAICAFMYATTGTVLAILGTWYFMVSDWGGINIGGKPNFTWYENAPAFVPILFEFSVFCGAHGMAITYLLRNGTLPGMPATNPDPRTTDDKFVMEITSEDNHGHSISDIESMLRSTDIYELSVKEVMA
ncbi:MAG: DUF3341 domain-containing protein [Flavobacteriales bacterium]|nr:DUF3341 domain-containing protein [Flavobacteriales bacterium]